MSYSGLDTATMFYISRDGCEKHSFKIAHIFNSQIGFVHWNATLLFTEAGGILVSWKKKSLGKEVA